MPEMESFQPEDNIVAQLNDSQRDYLVGLVNERWVYATHEIKDLIEQSRLAWDYFLHNTPRESSLALAGVKDSYAVEQKERKGLRFPHIPIGVESVLAMQHNTTFPDDDRFFRGIPENEFAQKNQESIEQFLSQNFGEVNISESFRKLRLNLILDGTACLFTRWSQKRNPRKIDYKPALEVKLPGEVGFSLGGVKKVKANDTIEWEGTEAIPLDFNDWRIDPAAISFDESWFIRRWYEPVYKLKQAYPEADVKPYNEAAPTTEENEKRAASGLKPIQQVIDPDFEEEGKKHGLIMACYDDFVIDDELYENYVAYILNGREVIWFGPNPYDHGLKPYIVAPYIAIPGQVYGQSGVVHAIPIAEAYDKAVDSMLRDAAWAAGKVFLKNINDPAVRQHKNIRVRPGLTLGVSDTNAYKELEISHANLEPLLVLMQNAEDKLSKVMGSSPFVEGGNPEQGRVSAFEIDQRVQGGNSRYLSLMKTFDNSFLERFMHIGYENLRQFMEKPVIINGEKVTRDTLRLAKFKWLITSTQATISRSRELANKRSFMVELLPQLISSGAVKLKPELAEFDLIQFVKEFATKGGEKDIDRFLKVIPGGTPQPLSLPGEEEVTQDPGVASALPSVPPTPNDARSELPPEPIT